MQNMHSARCRLGWLHRALAATLCAAAFAASAGVEQDFEQAGRAHRQGDFKASVAIWTALASAGQVDAQYNLGLIHLHGDGVAQDYGKALEWFRRAAEQGDKHAQFQIGGMYQRGEGVAADAEQAHRWFTGHLAHHHHHAHSEQMLAWRRQARDLLWARDMRESLAAPEAAAQVIAELRQRADAVAVDSARIGPGTALAAGAP
ncbi:MAG: sel1 repeat family protein [Comamonadaceae bacterium]|nr:sel1 repeat family protein [Comamonadaceae bacterium]